MSSLIGRSIGVGLVLSLVAACGPPSRDSAVVKSARKVCKRADACGTLEENYGSFRECRTEWEDTFYDSWSEASCGDGQINPTQLDECHAQIDAFDCDGSGLDVLSVLLTSCSANQVCAD